jgi:GGDEF domain-containing protein
MMGFRAWLAILLLWLGFVFNLERLHKPINIASFVYVLAALLASAIVVVPPMRRATIGWVAAGALALMFVLKVVLGYGLMGSSLPLTVTEAVVMAITVFLAHQIAFFTHRFEQTAAEVATSRWRTHPHSFEEGQVEMYRELRRARRFGRPLVLVTLEPTAETRVASIDRMVQEVRHEMIQRYLEVRLADVIQSEVHDCDQIANCNGRFILLLPETDQEQARAVMSQVASRAERDLGIRLRVGMAAFPRDELTLTGLVEHAEADMSTATGAPVGRLQPAAGLVRAADTCA